MRRINVYSLHPTVVFAAEELKKYLRMMMPEGGEIEICMSPDEEKGLSIGLLSDFGLEDSDVADTVLDEILYAETQGFSGIVAGNNPRAVLLSVYELLRHNGCRWLMPGRDGEFIPQRPLGDVSFRHKPSRRYRGWCNEGATSQEVLLDMIDFTPKVGMNLCMLQFRVPAVFYERYYGHRHNEENRLPEYVSREQVLQWTRECETEISKRSLQLHSIGHGFTIDPFGIDSANTWSHIEDSEIPEETRECLALVKGKRGLFGGIPANTNFCMSNPTARKRVADYVADYAQMHQNADALHVWLADDYNNHCECDACRKKTPSDWYMVLMNEIDAVLCAKKLPTRIVFIAYVNTCWAPIAERIRNSDRFVLLLAPITRSYTHTLPKEGVTASTTPYVENGISMPKTLEEYLAYFEDWKKTWSGANLCYEYHFWRHRIYDPSGLALAKRIYEDIGAYTDVSVDGLIQCGSQRSFFPNGFAYYVHARRLFDDTLSFEALQKEYFDCAYGTHAGDALSYFTEIERCFDVVFTEGEKSEDPSRSRYYCPAETERLQTVSRIAETGRELAEQMQRAETRITAVSARLLRYHAEYAVLLADFFAWKAKGCTEEAQAACERFRLEFGKYEERIEAYYDHFLAIDALHQIAYENDHGF
ncbi:MAG: DUF4838 domain-containing protein [Ruminococcaceae bacterium]|nr:DUF4838 domain-containing protein [Oscillospiraceae bacterium]